MLALQDGMLRRLFLSSVLLVCCLSCHAAAETAVLRDARTGGVVARVPVSHGAHGGVVKTHDRAVEAHKSADFVGTGSALPQKHTWVQQTVSAEGQASALKDVHMVPLMATEVFVVGEGGVVLKANVSQGTIGVQKFTTVHNAGFPHYYYGVYAGSDGGVLVSGFVDGAEDVVSKGITVASFDHGNSWQPPEVVDDEKWLGGPIRCTNDTHCVVPGASTNKIYVTDNGVASVASDWTSVVPDPSVGWFQGPFVAEAESIVITGIGLCESTDGGLHFKCKKSVDPTFDGGIALQAARPTGGSGLPHYGQGLVGGGEISNPVSGWVHETQNGPDGNWTKRDLEVPYPIRWVGFYGSVALAVGGDYQTGVGGIHSSTDGGKTWELDLDTGVEMSACSGSARDFDDVGGGSVVVTCAGSARGKPSVIVSTLLLLG